MFLNATDVRKDLSKVIDNAVREKPQFIKRTRDHLLLSDLNFINQILEPYHFTAKKFPEEDGSVTLELNEIDLAENGRTESEAKQNLAASILDYAKDFYDDFNYWSTAPNRKAQIPYVFRALILNNVEKIGDSITCRSGKN